MNQTKTAKRNIDVEVKWTIIFVVIQMLWFFGEKLAGLHDGNIQKQLQVAPGIILIGLAIFHMALREKRDKVFSGDCTFKQAYFTGFNLTVLITVLTPLMYYITYAMISPDYFDKVIEFSVTSGELSREEALDRYNLGTYLIQSVVGTFLVGMLLSAGVATMVRTKKQSEL